MSDLGTGKEFLGVGWAFPLSADMQGEIDTAAYEDDVMQAIRIILGTTPGERVMRPDFGSGLHALVFEPVSVTTIALVKYHVEQALVTWEPRIDNITVEVAHRPPEAKLTISIRYRVRTSNIFYNMVYPFYLLEGTQR